MILTLVYEDEQMFFKSTFALLKEQEVMVHVIAGGEASSAPSS